MGLSDLKVLLFEDNVYKAMDVIRALNECGIQQIDSVRNQETGFEKIYQGMQDGEPVGLIVTDMHYPLEYGADADYDAGFKLIERLKEEKMDIPVIICSSHNYAETAILGTVWYSELRDLRSDFREVLQKLKGQ